MAGGGAGRCDIYIVNGNYTKRLIIRMLVSVKICINSRGFYDPLGIYENVYVVFFPSPLVTTLAFSNGCKERQGLTVPAGLSSED